LSFFHVLVFFITNIFIRFIVNRRFFCKLLIVFVFESLLKLDNTCYILIYFYMWGKSLPEQI
jgi:hypothetical protein